MVDSQAQSKTIVGLMDPENWNSIWKKGFIPFHITDPNKYLVKYFDKILNADGPNRTFVPLCGKSVDILWLEENGHSVVGLEFSETAVNYFFKESNLEFTKSESGGLVKYKATNKDITIFQGDFFLANEGMLGKFDSVWDRGSFVAINPEERVKYCEIIRSLLKPNGKILMESVLHENPPVIRPPHSITDDEMKQCYGEFFTVQHLETENDIPLAKELNIKESFMTVYFFTMK